MNELSLFAGIGGSLLATAQLGFRPVCAVEKEPFCREVLFRRQRDGLLPLFPIWDDCRTFQGEPWRGAVDVLTAGFPCQPFSVAGRAAADADARNMWPDTIRIISEVRPRFAFLENVPGLLGRHGYFGTILSDLAKSGYNARWTVLSAAEVGAPHIRERLWILAYPSGGKLRNESGGGGRKGRPDSPKPRDNGAPRDSARTSEGQIKPFVDRAGDDLPHRVDRLKALGNAIVPPQMLKAWQILAEEI